MKKLFKWWEILIIVLLFGGLITLGALKDLEIAEMVFKPDSIFANICNNFGYFPSPIMAASGAMMLVNAPNKNNKFYSFIRICLIIGATGFAYYYIMDNLYDDFASFWYCLLGAFVVAISMFVTFLITKDADKKTLANVGMMIIFAVGFETGLIGVICKTLLARPRYRFVVSSSVDNFRNFWQFDSDLKDLYVTSGILESEFESFPSGHASGSMCLALLFTLPYFTKKAKFMSRIYLVIGIIFSLIVSYGRMVAGAHFLSDVACGMFITLIGIIVCYYIFINNKLD